MMKLSLYENAIDSITHGIDHFEAGNISDSVTDYKQALLLLFQGTELLLKSLLSQVNVIYIFDKNSLYNNCNIPLVPTLTELERCKSLEIDKLCTEVYKYYPSEFPKSSLNVVTSLAKYRNQVQHFGINIEKKKMVMLLGQLYFEVISVALRVLGNKMTQDINIPLQEETHKIFCFFSNAQNEGKMLSILGNDFTQGMCVSCGNYSLFMLYNESGYPERVYCSSCEFAVENINVDEYRICPECRANALLYIPEKEFGLCTWYKCCSHKDGGIPIEMTPCEKCGDYLIEGECICGNTAE